MPYLFHKISAKILFISSFFLLLTGIAVFSGSFQNNFSFAQAYQTFSETWQAVSGIYFQGTGWYQPGVYRQGIPSDGSPCSVGLSQCFFQSTGWQVQGTIGSQSYSEDWLAVDGFYTKNKGEGFYGYFSAYLAGIPPDGETCQYNCSFSPRVWEVRGKIIGQPTFYSETWQASGGVFVQNNVLKSGSPGSANLCLSSSSRYSSGCSFSPTSWRVSGKISAAQESILPQKHYFVSRNNYSFDSQNSWIGESYSQVFTLIPDGNSADQFCVSDSQALAGKKYRAVFSSQIAPNGWYIYNSQFGEGTTGGVSYLKNSDYFHTGMDSYCRYNSYDETLEANVFGRRLEKDGLLGSFSAKNIAYETVSRYSNAACWSGNFQVFRDFINKQNLKLLCLEQ